MASLRPTAPLPATMPGVMPDPNQPLSTISKPLPAPVAPKPYGPTDPSAFTGKTFSFLPPQSTPYGDFTAPDPMAFQHSPDYQYLLDQQAKTRERSAAARGTLLTPGTVAALQRDAAGIAAGDYGNAFNRALSVYGTNRDTNAQNFGQNQSVFGNTLDAFRANTDAALGYARLDNGGGGGSSGGGGGSSLASMRPGAPVTMQGVSDDYASQVARQRAQNEAAASIPPPPKAPPTTTRYYREYR